MTSSFASCLAPLGRLAGALLLGGAALLSGCVTSMNQDSGYAPIVFVHGNGDSAALWQSTVWRFETNGWPASRLHAIDVPYPLARDEDLRPQPGRTSTAEHMQYLKAEVDAVLARTGAPKVILVGN
ncbi:MAG TPA: twin-arginine translocation pathway signal, partial [Lautropia sp.]|nr:twin-arginine translocation pathway signal [Lautropia sp.]